MAQYKVWEKEYKDSSFVTKYNEPQKFILRFLKFLKKKESVGLSGLRVLDLGCGTGRNGNYLSEMGAEVVGIDISDTAIEIAKRNAKEKGLSARYLKGDIGEELDFSGGSFDLVLDVTASNSLNEKEREVYLKEVERVLKKGSYFFVRVLNKDGDKNAKRLLKDFPSKEKDTYIMPDINLIERVFSKEDFVEMYSEKFKVLKLVKESGYSKFKDRVYKRNFLIGYLKK